MQRFRGDQEGGALQRGDEQAQVCEAAQLLFRKTSLEGVCLVIGD